jgi:hypothetical protein
MVVSTKFHDFKIVPPASPYIIIPPGGIIIYELTGGNISKKRNVVDPNNGTSWILRNVVDPTTENTRK